MKMKSDWYADKILVPGLFYDDHNERELPTPRCQLAQGRGLWIRRDDPATKELLDDAEYYADPHGPIAWDPDYRSLRKSAKLTAQRIRTAFEEAKTITA